MDRRTAAFRDRLDAHVFVCTNGREEYVNCADAGAESVAEAVREWLRERDAYWSSVGVTETDCLGLCSEDGAAVCLQPADEWYAGVQPEDVPTLLGETLEGVSGVEGTDNCEH